jgi:putative Mg2+ transporter-C (MgtC) family protein
VYQINLFGIDFLELNAATVVLRLVLAMVCGSILGIERSRKRRAAGMRTFILICTGSCLVMMISQFLNAAYAANTDLARMGAQVINGIGFICAGTILLTGNHKVTGLTTAASLWAAASIGLAVGAGFYLGAAVMCAVMLTAMLGFDGYQDRLGKKTFTFHIYVVAHDKPSISRLLQIFRDEAFSISEVSPAPNDLLEGIAFICLLRSNHKRSRKDTLSWLGTLPGVLHVEEV